jgi:hypothetical protein
LGHTIVCEYGTKVFPLSEDMFVPSEASFQMKSKVSNIFCLWERLVVDINHGEVSWRFVKVICVDLDPFVFSHHRESQ